MTPPEKSDSPHLPVAIGLCPTEAHMQEFYFPLDAPEPERCPEPGCERMLVIYERKDQP